jgi:hypothetical protein
MASFLSKQNAGLLQEILQEESIHLGTESFHQMASDFAQKKGQHRLPLMEMNKQFLLMIRMAYQQLQQRDPQQTQPPSPSYPSPLLQASATTTLPSRPTGARSKNVTFDQELELHRQHFQQYAAPPPPTPPVFQDPEASPMESDLQALMKRTMNERKYDSAPPSQLQSNVGRKLQIGSAIEETIPKEEVIDLETLSSRENSTSSDFFSKLKTTTQISREITNSSSSSSSSSSPFYTDPPATTTTNTPNDDLQHTVNKLQTELEESKRLLSQLSEEFAAFKIYIYNIGLKESPPSLS